MGWDLGRSAAELVDLSGAAAFVAGSVPLGPSGEDTILWDERGVAPESSAHQQDAESTDSHGIAVFVATSWMTSGKPPRM